MSIEFRCTQCQRLLRTGDDAAGKQAQCPGCGTVLMVPAAAGEVASGSAPPVPGATPPPAGATPFGSSPPGAAPFGSPWAGAASGGPQGPGGPVNPYVTPGDFPGSPRSRPAGPPTPVVPTIVNLGNVFSRTWTVFKDQYGICLGFYLATFGLSFAAGIVTQLVKMATQAGSHDAAVVVVVTMIVTLARILFDIWIALGQVRGMISIARGQPTSIGVLFSGGPYLIPCILAGILLGLVNLAIWLIGAAVAGPVAFLGLHGGGEERWIVALVGSVVLAMVPVIVVFLTFSQFHYFIIDRTADALESLGLSRQITSGNKLTLFCSYLLVGLLGIAGTLACCVGLLFGVGPYVALLLAMFYLTMSGQTTADQLRYESWQNPPPMPPFPSV